MVRAATREMPAEVWASLREAGLIDPDYDSPTLWEA
jgi:hypothetical protein